MSSTKRQPTACTTNGANLERTVTGYFQVTCYVYIFMDVISKSLELAFANPSGCDLSRASAATCLLGMWVRIPPGALPVYLFSLEQFQVDF